MSFRNWLLPNLLFFPLAAHWLLPAGLEDTLYVNIGLPFFLPDICYFLYIILYNKKRENKKCMNSNTRNKVVVLSAILFIYSFFQLLLFTSCPFEDVFLLLLCNSSFVYFPFIFFAFPLTRPQIQPVKKILLFTSLIIVLEVILYGSGLLFYTAAGGDEYDLGYDYGGIVRVNTTIGAATGTGLVLCLVGIFVLCFIDLKSYIRFIFLGLNTVGVFFTISRGSIITWSLFLFFYFISLVKGVKKKNFGKVVLPICLFAAIMYYGGVLDPVLEREQTKREIGSDMTSGRDDRVNSVFQIINNSGGMGVGSGRVYPEKCLIDIIKSPYRMGPHNVYLTYLAELGYIGTVLIIIMYVIIIFRIGFHSTIGKIIPIIFLVNFNTEALIITAEVLPFIFFMLMVGVQNSKKNNNEKNIIFGNV